MFPNRTLYLFWFCISCTSYAVQHGPLPQFDFKGIFLHPDQLKYSPNDDLIHPTIIRTTGRVKNPLGKYYLYYAPHKHIAISMSYSDSLNGPWKEYHQNPVLRGPSGPDIRWIEEEKRFFIWGHQKNSQTEMWSSLDGINFTHQGISIKAENIGTRNATYSRTYKYPIEKYDSQYVMFYSGFDEKEGIRSVWLAHSKDAKNWTQLQRPILSPTSGEGNDLYGPALVRWKDKNYLSYQDHTAWRGGNLKYVELDNDLNPPEKTTPRFTLISSETNSTLQGRIRGSEFYFDKNDLYLFSSGSKSPRVLFYAKAKIKN